MIYSFFNSLYTRDTDPILKAGEPNRELIPKGYCLSFGRIGVFCSNFSKQLFISSSNTQSKVRALQFLVFDIIFIVKLCK